MIRVVFSLALIFSLTLLGACAKQGAPDFTPKLWSLPVGGGGYSALDGNLLVGYLDVIDEQLAAVDVVKREIIWRPARGVTTTFNPAFTVGERTVFIFLTGKGLHIYNREGELLSQVAPPAGDDAEGGGISAGPLLEGQLLFVPNRRYLYAYDVSELNAPTLLWRKEFANSILSLAVDTSGVYVGGASVGIENSLVKLELESGQEVWRATPQQIDASSLTVHVLEVADNALLGYVQGSLQAFDPATGERLWTALLTDCPDGAGVARAFEVGGGRAYISPNSGSCIFAVDLATGQEVWTVATGEVGPDGAISIGGRPLYHNGVVYTSVERLWALDAQTGAVLSFASQQAYNTILTEIHYANGEILVWGDELTAYKPLR